MQVFLYSHLHKILCGHTKESLELTETTLCETDGPRRGPDSSYNPTKEPNVYS